MAFTRFHDDPYRIMKKIQESTDQGLYYLNQPGTGDKPAFIADPSIIHQKWGGNLRTNAIDLESHLKGIGNPLTKSNINSRAPLSYKINYPHYTKDISSHSRISHPIWELRGKFDDPNLRNHRILHLDPQNNTELPFYNNISTRILEKNNHKALGNM